MPENIEEIQVSTEEQEPLDFDSSESRMNFLKGQLNDLVDGINSVYGQDLMDELLKRLEKTVEDFNEEVSGLIGKLKAGKIFEEDDPEASAKAPTASDETDENEAPIAEKSIEDQDEEDSDIIARMRARITHD